MDKLENNNFEILILFGQDNLNFEKKNEFIIYIGSHGDKGASIADVILPGATYTEQDGYFTNLEGKLQKAYKASYPPGEAKEDWQIINELSSFIKRKNLYKDKNQLIDSLINYLKLIKINCDYYLIYLQIFLFVLPTIHLHDAFLFHLIQTLCNTL